MTSLLDSPYEELPLDPSQRTIRLWRFKNVRALEWPHLELVIFDDLNRPTYTALSYTWGSANLGSRRVRVNHGEVSITKNLWDFLLVLYADVSNADTWLWADQISLDQSNTSERDHQVGLMDQIYSQAARVYAWTGQLQDVPVFNIQPLCTSTKPDKSWISERSFAITVLWMATQLYWTRLWIVQELHLARDVIIYCRTYAIQAKRFQRAVEDLNRYIGSGDWLTQKDEDTRESRRDNSAILGRTSALHDIYEPKIDALFARTDLKQRRTSLESVLNTYCDNNCSDLRDKVFGLQALVKEPQRITINYSLSTHELFLDTVKLMINLEQPYNAFEASSSSYYSGNGRRRSMKPKLNRFDKFARAMRMPCRDAQALYFSHLLAHIPQDLRNTWRSISGNGWWAMWHNIEDVAVTPKQKGLALELHSIATAYRASQPGFDQELYDVVHARSYEGLKADIAAKAESLIERVAKQHGFQRYGEFLAHPDDWPSPKEKTLKALIP